MVSAVPLDAMSLFVSEPSVVLSTGYGGSAKRSGFGGARSPGNGEGRSGKLGGPPLGAAPKPPELPEPVALAAAGSETGRDSDSAELSRVVGASGLSVLSCGVAIGEWTKDRHHVP